MKSCNDCIFRDMSLTGNKLDQWTGDERDVIVKDAPAFIFLKFFAII